MDGADIMSSMRVSRRVLIIDDNVGLAENIAEMLEIDGHVTQVAASAEQGRALALEHEPDVVVTDYRLPGQNGADFVKQFRKNHLNLHALVISAYSDDATIRQARDAGATFMVKPLDLFLLSRWVREGSA
jgi:DNA-binding NtrC family response regulator